MRRRLTVRSAIEDWAFAVWVLAFAACAMSFPEALISWGGFETKRAVVPLVQLIMFGMGTTLSLEDFARVIRMPKAVLTGVALQYTVMPLTGWAYAALFGLRGEVAAGLILYGSCAGGVSSNVITYIAGAEPGAVGHVDRGFHDDVSR